MAGSSSPSASAAAWADFDRDGDLDLVTAGRLFRNQGAGQHWLELRVTGDGTKVNRSAIGTQVRLKIGDRILTRQVEAGTGEGNQNDLTLHVGLGEDTGPVNLEVSWPGGAKQQVPDVAVDRMIDISFTSP